jgi:hypothetical protein
LYHTETKGEEDESREGRKEEVGVAVAVALEVSDHGPMPRKWLSG